MKLQLSALVFPLIIVSSFVNRTSAEEPVSFSQLEHEYQSQIQPLLKEFCNDCHSTESKEGELDLERFAGFSDVRADAASWQKIPEMIQTGEMPPEESPQLSAEQQTLLQNWIRNYLNAESHANAGDPGPVVLRRLNNAEYTYTIRDLIGVPLSPAAEFPVDSAAGEGFTNIGNSLVMSPALVTKYYDAAKSIAEHAVLLPEGIRFSAGNTRRDWTNEVLEEIIGIYERHTGKLKDASSLNKWNVPDPTVLTNEDGRVDLGSYLSALIRHRETLLTNLDSLDKIAAEENLNAKYLRALATMLVSSEPDSLLLNRLRTQWRNATSGTAPQILAEVRSWQSKLWKYNSVGHFGSMRPWQEATDPLVESQAFRVKFEPEQSGQDLTLTLHSVALGTEPANGKSRWKEPRFERPGRSSLYLSDIKAVSTALERLRTESLVQTAQYLSAAYEFKQGTDTSEEAVSQLAEKYGLHLTLFKSWLLYLGLDQSEVAIQDYLHVPFQEKQHPAVKGWGFPNSPALLVVSNSSDELLKVPGNLPPHQIGVHPRPERRIAVGWKSPLKGKVTVQVQVKDAHNNCGNGISWALELRRGNRKQNLKTGLVDLGKEADIAPLTDLEIKPGDLLSLVIGPRDRNHSCDLTQVDLTITEQLAEKQGEKRVWSLSKDCADSIESGNPHVDRLGNQAVWHFYSTLIEGNESQITIPKGSLIAKWLEANAPQTVQELANQLQTFLSQPLEKSASEPDQQMYRQLTTLNGELFSRLDFKQLTKSVQPKETEQSSYGLAFDSANWEEHDLLVNPSSTIEIKLPGELISGSEFVTEGGVTEAHQALQFQVSTGQADGAANLFADQPIVVKSGSPAANRMKESMNDFRHYFPLAMCYTKIVPVDEVVTIVLFHREDDHLVRLMLNDEEITKLDQLWEELRYISQDALTSLTVFEQLMEFASQDGDPALYEPLRIPFNQRAERFRKLLLDSESKHLDALIEFAHRAYRRPLTEQERDSLRHLYRQLREQNISHEEAFRLTLARVLTSPAFLYRLEHPHEGKEASTVSDWELANRVSYFLWSSASDEQLRQLAQTEKLQEKEVLTQQVRRLLKSPRARRLAIEFACQWLHVRDFDRHDEKSEQHFPEFNELRSDMYEETILFFTDLFQRDGSVLELIDADHTFLNERLAMHYGIPGIQGDEWRRVEGVKRYSRGGILTQATTLSKQSGASRTSAILRGNWIYESLLGERLPRPPLDVPVLPENVPEGLTERQLIEQHSSVKSCAKCHQRIDGFGFSLEGFDAIGRHRTVDQGNHPIDTKAVLHDGTEFEGLSGLQNYLINTRRDTFVRQFCRKLLGYALGRSVQLSDEPLLDKMMADLKKNDYRISTVFDNIVLSDQFRKIRGKDFPASQVLGQNP